MAGRRNKAAIRSLAHAWFHRVKVRTVQAVVHFIEFIMVLATLFWAADARALSGNSGHKRANPEIKQTAMQTVNLAPPRAVLLTRPESKGGRGPASVYFQYSELPEGSPQRTEHTVTELTEGMAEGHAHSGFFSKPVLHVAPEVLNGRQILPESLQENRFYAIPTVVLMSF